MDFQKTISFCPDDLLNSQNDALIKNLAIEQGYLQS